MLLVLVVLDEHNTNVALATGFFSATVTSELLFSLGDVETMKKFVTLFFAAAVALALSLPAAAIPRQDNDKKEDRKEDKKEHKKHHRRHHHKKQNTTNNGNQKPS